MLRKDSHTIAQMFDEIAPRYDFLNHFFTVGQDIRWRNKIINYLKAQKVPVNTLLDIAAGTGDSTRSLLKLNPQELFALDISPKMLEVLRKKINSPVISILNGRAEAIPLPDIKIDIALIAFGIRNFEDIDKALREIHRVLKDGGILVILEMFSTDGKQNPLFKFYFSKLIPFLGNKISRSNYAYSYLFNSVDTFFTPSGLSAKIESSGFKLIHQVNNFLHIVHTLYFRKV
ncbi:MAG: ubiquinone/menaquinone biosynthesis methyltransferase [Ignavibacteria bacterium]